MWLVLKLHSYRTSSPRSPEPSLAAYQPLANSLPAFLPLLPPTPDIIIIDPTIPSTGDATFTFLPLEIRHEIYGWASNSGENGDGEEEDQEVENEKMSGGVVDEDDDDGDDAGDLDDATATQTITAAPRFRYIENLMIITHCPPPVALLLTSKELSAEAIEWYYDAAILHIHATELQAPHIFRRVFRTTTRRRFLPDREHSSR
ncbi:hypothetical protein GQ43DRAFT_435300 [Delitschia confertaspora ATCC 74209]|uniref:Uncharacterized protein n=1 Tax=Delitschia confertaspora ATCC 74209 TaxID=1513339 RepID=A0A9P4JG09_9PLEO|nr:hypothetical protein GQ43DRAFT_435300 [Delitschia confertaspora ATCC 74209]